MPLTRLLTLIVVVALPLVGWRTAPAAAQDTASPTLDALKARRQLVCGVSGESPGFSLPDSQGVMRGLDADTCRAVAAAALGNAGEVRFAALSPITRFTALQSGEVDLLVRNTGWTLTREASLGLMIGFVNIHDGTGFVMKAETGVKSARELDVADWFRAQGLKLSPVLIAGVATIQETFLSGRCDAWANDMSYLPAFRTAQGAGKLLVLPERISNDLVGTLARKGDDRSFDLVRCIGFALLAAERDGITSANVDQKRQGQEANVQRLVGVQGDLGKLMGVGNPWAYETINQVGNYGEIWNRTVAPLGIDRGPNKLAGDGGLMFAPPIR